MVHSLTIKKTLDGLLNWVTNNQNNADIPDNEKFLYHVFNGMESDGFDFLQQAISLVLRTSRNPRRLETRLQFDPARASIPTIHVTLPADSVGVDNSIGMGANGNFYEYENGAFNMQYQRSFTGNYDLIISSANPNETTLIYELVLHLFIAAADTLNRNFDMFTYSGREIMMNNQLSPDRIFTKNVSLTVYFKRHVPSVGYYSQFTSSITFNPDQEQPGTVFIDEEETNDFRDTYGNLFTEQ